MDKSADKWARLPPGHHPAPGHGSYWHERWGERYEADGGEITKWTDRWAEREAEGTAWGDKWEERHNANSAGGGRKVGETWKHYPGGQWQQWWGEESVEGGDVVGGGGLAPLHTSPSAGRTRKTKWPFCARQRLPHTIREPGQTVARVCHVEHQAQSLPERLIAENVRKFMKIGLNGVAMSPHGLIFDEDEATGCPMPLEPFPTPFRLV